MLKGCNVEVVVTLTSNAQTACDITTTSQRHHNDIAGAFFLRIAYLGSISIRESTVILALSQNAKKRYKI